MKKSVPTLAAVLLLILVGGHLRADWITDGGFPELQAELGGATPTGAGIIVLQSEANEGGSPPAFMPESSASSPFAGSGIFVGKTFTVDSPLGNASGHSAGVGSVFYSNSGSVSPGIVNVHVMLADTYINNLAGNAAPSTLAGSVSNHSWIGNSTNNVSIDERILRAHDFMINRDGVVTCVPLNNGIQAHPIFLANSYNSISVGLRSGQHSQGPSTADGLGRMKPDIVVNQGLTSYATPGVASAAAMLREAVKASYAAADNPQTIKAIILAGASKDRLLGWSRPSTGTPYDAVYGAGELNMLNSYHILAGGRQLPQESTEIADKGWNFGTAQTAAVQRYFFSVPPYGNASTFSAVLTWHRTVTRVGINYTTSLPNLDLKLYASNGFTLVPTPISQSVSTLDNVEHLFLRHLPPGQYALEVSTTVDNIDYGLAWEAQSGPGPAVTVRKEPDNSTHLDLTNLDPLTTYAIRQSGDLVSWSTATTVRTTDTTPATTYTWQDPESPVPDKKFYKLEWTAVR